MMFGLVPLLVLAIIAVLIARAVAARSGGDPVEHTGTTIRRFFQYAALLAVLIVAAIGLAGLVGDALPRGDVIFRDSTDAARSLAFLVVGGPVYWGLLRWAWPALRDNEAERASTGWTFYLTAASFTSLIVAGTALYQTLQWVFRVRSWNPDDLGTAVVWAGVWAWHVWLIRRLGVPGRVGLLRAAGAAAGLGASASAAGLALGATLGWTYGRLAGTELVGRLSEDLRLALAGAIVGGLVWWWYWFRHLLPAAPSGVRHAYVLLAGVLSGVVVVLVSIAGLIFTTLEWFFGDVGRIGAAAHFDVVAGAAAGIVIGGALWGYHRGVLPTDGARAEVDRLYDHLLAGVGLVAAVGGLTTLVVAFIEAIGPETLAEVGASATDTLLAAVTVLVVGSPLWWVSWSRIQQFATADAAELRSPTRRTYLSVFFGLAGVISLISLLAAVVIAFEAWFDGAFGWDTVREMRVPIALVGTIGAVAYYHWTVWRADRMALAEATPQPGIREVTLVSGGGDGPARALSRRLEVPVRHWRRLDRGAAPVDVDALEAELRAADGERVIVVVDDTGAFDVIPVTAGQAD